MGAALIFLEFDLAPKCHRQIEIASGILKLLRAHYFVSCLRHIAYVQNIKISVGACSFNCSRVLDLPRNSDPRTFEHPARFVYGA